jgi:dolichol-phosphate mannosyltransferase
MISVIVPTYNEKENIQKLIPAVHKALSKHEHEMIVVDDNSPDGTAKVAEELSKEYPVSVLKRKGKLGLASAIFHGFAHAKGDVLGVIDADLQHPPEYVEDFALTVMNGHDIAVGSRYTRGGKIEGWSKYRTLVSKGAIVLSKPLTNVKDPMSGYFFLKRRVIEGVKFSPTGYKILLEILAKGSYKNVKEIPYTFKIRRLGKSKLGAGEYLNYLKLLYYLYGFKFKTALNGRVQRKMEGFYEKSGIGKRFRQTTPVEKPGT